MLTKNKARYKVDSPINTSGAGFLIEDINESNISKFIKEYSNLILYFHAPWATPCRKMKLRIRNVCKEWKDITVGIVNADENVKICEKYNIVLLPQLIYVHNQTPISFLKALQDCDVIKKWINDTKVSNIE